MKIKRYDFFAPVERDLRFVFVSDLHGYDNNRLISEIRALSPDAILIPGDFIHSNKHFKDGIEFLDMVAGVAPTFCSLGNHEMKFSGDVHSIAHEAGVRLLDNETAEFMSVKIGGLSSGYMKDEKQGHFERTPRPDVEWLRTFASEDGYKILLSHHPEYYPRYIRDLSIDLTLSGHAHGGQWRIFGRGVFAPGQGLFPKYTSGLYDGKLIVSRGLGNMNPFPRINNSPEIIVINLKRRNER